MVETSADRDDLRDRISAVEDALIQIREGLAHIESLLAPEVLIDVGFGSARIEVAEAKPMLVTPSIPSGTYLPSAIERDLGALSRAVSLACEDLRTPSRFRVSCLSDDLLDLLLHNKYPDSAKHTNRAEIWILLSRLSKYLRDTEGRGRMVKDGLRMEKDGVMVGVYPNDMAQEKTS